MLMLIAHDEKEIMLMKQTRNGRVVSKQQDNREVGFRHYMHDHFPDVVIDDLELPLEGTRNEYNKMLEDFFFASGCQAMHNAWLKGTYSRRFPAEDKPPRRADNGL